MAEEQKLREHQNIGTNEQKKDWFLRLDPNGRIPILVDNSVEPTFTVHETSAELLYLEKKYDKDNKFGFKDDLERNEALQWLFFWHGSGAPYQGQVSNTRILNELCSSCTNNHAQVHHFTRAAPEKLEYAINRFRNETLRVFGVLEIRLSGKYTGEPRDYLAGKGKGKYSVADIGTYPWIAIWEFSGFTEEERAQFPHLKKWIDRIAERPAVKIAASDKYTKDGNDPSVSKWKLE
jgi:glutathione S-transferase